MQQVRQVDERRRRAWVAAVLDDCCMPRVTRLAEVPTQELLPGLSESAAQRIVQAANRLDELRTTTDTAVWDWYPDKAAPPAVVPGRAVPLLFGTSLSLFHTATDWLELAVDVAWSAPPLFTVSARVEVACWCSTDHGAHAVQTQEWLVGTGEAAGEALVAAVEAVVAWLNRPHHPSVWRARSGLPNPP
jgi:hypothetical protein